MEKYYTCKYDKPFKEIFSKESNQDLLISLLESILHLKIDSIEILNKEQNTGNVHIRGKTVDFMVKTNIGKIEIELNTLSNQDKVVSKFMNELNKDSEFRIYMTEEEDNRKKMNTYRQEGLEEGLEKGKTEEKQDIAKRMLAKGMSIEDIIEISGLSKEEVEALKS